MSTPDATLPETPETTPAAIAPDLAAQQRYIENLRKLRDEQFLKKPLSQLQN